MSGQSGRDGALVNRKEWALWGVEKLNKTGRALNKQIKRLGFGGRGLEGRDLWGGVSAER